MSTTPQPASQPAEPVATRSPVQASEWSRPRPSRRELRQDVVLGLVMAAAGVCGTELARSASPTHVEMGAGGIEGYLLSAAVALPLCLRRRYPLVVLVAIALLFFTAGERVPVAFFANIVTQAALFMAIYAATAWAPDRRRLKVTMIVVVVGMFSWLFYGFVKALQNDTVKGLGQGLLSPYVSYVILNIGINVAYFFGAYFWGRTAWRTARQHDELERQAAELAAQQQANARRAVIDERLRISRELHDVVAHHISSIGVQAGGARRVVDTDPEASKAALSVIEESSRTAVNEMRQLLGMLRAADPDLDEEVGTPAIKAPQAAPVGSRLGHVGIRERVSLLGGESEIGPRPVGGFRVRARFPIKGPGDQLSAPADEGAQLT